MSGEPEPGEGEHVYDEYGDPGPGSEAPSPSRPDNGLDTIGDADPDAQRAEGGSNTAAHASEHPGVIGSYTDHDDNEQAAGDGGGAEDGEGGAGEAAGEQEGEQEGEEEEEDQEQEETPPPPSHLDLQPLDEEEPGPQDEGEPGQQQPDQDEAAGAGGYANGEEAGPGEGDPAPDGGEGGDAEPGSGAGDQEDSQPEPGDADAEAGADAGAEGDADYGGDDGERPLTAQSGAEQADGATQADVDADAEAQTERPASAQGEQPDASTSRPGSGAASARPGSARPGSARPASGRPASGRRGGSAEGSRPASGARVQLTPDSVGLPAPAGPGYGDAGAPPRPGTSQGGSRPGSRPSAAAAAGGGVAAAPVPGAAGGEARGPSREAPHSLPPTIPEDQPLVAPALIERYIAPGLKAIEVEVEQGPGLPHRLVRVLLDLTQAEAKPYLGGFRNKRTGAVYHHAGTQTPRAPKYSEADRKLSRETQTVKIKQHSQQTVREQATQMARPGVELDEQYDRPVQPGKYQTADEREAIVVRATRCIQRWVRGYLGRKRAAYLRKKKAEREAFLREQEARAQREAEEHRRREIQRRMHPRTAADFEVLYNELEAWRLQETRRIKEAGLPKDQEQQVLQQVLHKETKLLQTIDRLKINANQENKEARIQHTLNEMSKPKKFALRNGGKVDVHTPFTTRAKELQQLYNGLNLPLLTVDERLDVLLHVKWTVKEFDCDLTREVVELIDREADLLNRGRSAKVLEGLRKRISSLFLNFIETPEFNPEAVRFQIVPMDFETYLYENVGKGTAKAGASMGGARAVAA